MREDLSPSAPPYRKKTMERTFILEYDTNRVNPTKYQLFDAKKELFKTISLKEAFELKRQLLYQLLFLTDQTDPEETRKCFTPIPTSSSTDKTITKNIESKQ